MRRVLKKEFMGKNNCWNCKFQNLANDTFLGLCTWFKIHKNQQPKEILPDRVDKGCKFFQSKSE